MPLPSLTVRSLVAVSVLVLLAGCSAREIQDSLAGSTAQRLVTHSIDDMVRALPEGDFRPLNGQRLHLVTHFIEAGPLRDYADRRLALELERRFGIEIAEPDEPADRKLNVFYTSLGTDAGLLGFYVPLGFIPGMHETARINLLTLEQFHGVAEMYYFLGEAGTELRGGTLRARTRTDALGLPIITIPISSIDRR